MSGDKRTLKGLAALAELLPREQRARLAAGASRPSSAKAGKCGVAKDARPPAQPAPSVKNPPRPKPSSPSQLEKPPANVRFEALDDTPMQYAVKPAKALAPTDVIPPNELRDEAALHHVLRAIHDVRFSITEPRPSSCASEVEALVRRRVAAGATVARLQPKPDPDGFIVGVDFGTSSTKVILHQPWAAGEPAVALPVPEALRSQGVEHLWQTVVWCEPQTGAFSLVPRARYSPVDGFKAGLIQRLGGYADLAGVPRCLAATAYLAQLFAYVLGFYADTRPLGSVGASHFQAFHIGVPVATKDDPLVLPEFLRVAAAAMALLPQADALTRSNVQEAYKAASIVRTEADLVGARLYTELEGVIGGYLATPDRAQGAHMVVDVGASTLDVATFRLWAHDGDLTANIYAAGVEMLGAQALEWARAADVPDVCFRRAGCFHAWRQFRRTWMHKDRGFDRRLSSEPVRFLFVGGGRLTSLHQNMFTEPEKDLYLGAPTLTPTPADPGVWSQDVDFTRLLVAYGLSRDPVSIPAIRLPSQMEDEPERVRDWTSAFPSKDIAQ